MKMLLCNVVAYSVRPSESETRHFTPRYRLYMLPEQAGHEPKGHLHERVDL